MTHTGTPHPHGPEPAGVSASLATVMASVVFFALAIAGLGALSFFTDADIIAVPGLGQGPGAWGMVAALAVFAGTLWATVRRARPVYPRVVVTLLAVPVAHLAVVWVAALGAGPLAATTVARDLVLGGTSAVLAGAAAVAAWGGVALRRTRASRPRWRWEHGSSHPDDL